MKPLLESKPMIAMNLINRVPLWAKILSRQDMILIMLLQLHKDKIFLSEIRAIQKIIILVNRMNSINKQISKIVQYKLTYKL